MKKMTVAVAVGAVALVGGGATAATAAAASPAPASVDVAAQVQRVPDALKVPDGNKLIATFQGDGVQIYGCTNAAWTFIQPAATLTRNGQPVAVHFAGPSFPRWESTKDGSLVGAKRFAGVDEPGAVPQLLLQAQENTGGPGTQFGTVTFVQRLNTRGGLAPAGACAAGAQVSVHYTADYAFWAAQ